MAPKHHKQEPKGDKNVKCPNPQCRHNGSWHNAVKGDPTRLGPCRACGIFDENRCEGSVLQKAQGTDGADGAGPKTAKECPDCGDVYTGKHDCIAKGANFTAFKDSAKKVGTEAKAGAKQSFAEFGQDMGKLGTALAPLKTGWKPKLRRSQAVFEKGLGDTIRQKVADFKSDREFGGDRKYGNGAETNRKNRAFAGVSHGLGSYNYAMASRGIEGNNKYWGRCKHCNVQYKDHTKVDRVNAFKGTPHKFESRVVKSVAMGTRPFGRKTVGSTESPVIRAKAPRYRKGGEDEETPMEADAVQKSESPEQVDCPSCGYDAFHLGTLGNREHFRCRGCGVDFSRRGATPKVNKMRAVREAMNTDPDKHHPGSIGKGAATYDPGTPKGKLRSQAIKPKVSSGDAKVIKQRMGVYVSAKATKSLASYTDALTKSFSKQHFEAAAEALGRAHASAAPEDKGGVEHAMHHLGQKFAQTNSRFDFERFHDAVMKHSNLHSPDPHCGAAWCEHPRSSHDGQVCLDCGDSGQKTRRVAHAFRFNKSQSTYQAV